MPRIDKTYKVSVFSKDTYLSIY